MSRLQARSMRSTDRWGAMFGLAGALVWAVLAAFAGARHAPLGVIELLFLFAVLVIVPLGLALFEKMAPPVSAFRVARFLQPFAAISAVVSILAPRGIRAAALVLPWLIVGLLVALSGAINLLKNKSWSLISLVMAISGADLALASGWLVVSRLGLRSFGF